MVKTDTRTDADKLIDFGLDFLGLWALLMLGNLVFAIIMAVMGIPFPLTWSTFAITGITAALILRMERKRR